MVFRKLEMQDGTFVWVNTDNVTIVKPDPEWVRDNDKFKRPGSVVFTATDELRVIGDPWQVQLWLQTGDPRVEPGKRNSVR